MTTIAEVRSLKTELFSQLFPQTVTGVYANAFKADAEIEGLSPRSTAPIPDHHNIVGVAWGQKITNGKPTGTEAIKVYVKQKTPKSSLLKSEMIPEQINGKPTDVVVTGPIRAHATAVTTDPKVYTRPTECGISVGHYLITAGTLGCMVEKIINSNTDKYILSNNHVLADSNNAHLGDVILQQGTYDGGNVKDKNYWVANLSEFEPIRFGGAANHMDAAIAKVIDPKNAKNQIVQIGSPNSAPIAAKNGLVVHKFGRTTDYTVGTIADIYADIWVGYDGLRAWFEDQLSIKGNSMLFSAGGDSGSLILGKNNNEPVGLLFAGGGDYTFANPIELVLNRFNIQILG